VDSPEQNSYYCNDGHTDIPHEVLEALAKENLSPNEWRCLMVILRLTWGWHKRKDRIPLSKFVKKTGIKKQNVSNTIARLIERNMIITDYDTKGTTYRFQDKFEKWKRSLSPMTISKSVKKLRRVMVTYDAGSLSPITKESWSDMTKASLSPMTSKESKENKEIALKEREGEVSPLPPPTSTLFFSSKENPDKDTQEWSLNQKGKPLFLEENEHTRQKPRYLHPKRDPKEHKKLIESQRRNFERSGRFDD
jgi:phage replication O-like protein O